MTLTTAIILNAILMAGIIVALARFIHLPLPDREAPAEARARRVRARCGGAGALEGGI